MKNFDFFCSQNLGLPLIKFTRSLDGSTGTASFLFKNFKNFEDFKNFESPIYKISLSNEKNILLSNQVKIFFKEGKPCVLLIVFVLKNKIQWKLIYDYIRPLVLKYKLNFYYL